MIEEVKRSEISSFKENDCEICRYFLYRKQIEGHKESDWWPVDSLNDSRLNDDTSNEALNKVSFFSNTASMKIALSTIGSKG